MIVLVDSSIWIDYFRARDGSESLEWMIEEGLIATNELILAELLPPLKFQKHSRLVALLREIPRLPLNIEWDEIVEYQLICLRHGINKVGMPDIIIAQNAIQHGALLFSTDKHFRLMAEHLPLQLND